MIDDVRFGSMRRGKLQGALKGVVGFIGKVDGDEHLFKGRGVKRHGKGLQGAAIRGC
jgi:hypothetical protein